MWICSALRRSIAASHGGLATLFTHPNGHPYDNGLIVADSEQRVTQWLTKEDARPQYYRNRVNAGLHPQPESCWKGTSRRER